MSQVKDQEIRGRRTRTYLRYLNDQEGTLISNMQTLIKEIYHHQSHAFKINLSFSFILQHCETLEYRYFYASNNEQLLKSPRLIRNQRDLQNLLNHLAAKDFPSLLKEQRPNMKWIIEREPAYPPCYQHIPTRKAISFARLHQEQSLYYWFGER